MKKITSVLLSLMMLLSCLPYDVSAAQNSRMVTSPTQQEPSEGYEVNINDEVSIFGSSSDEKTITKTAENSDAENVTRYTVLALDTSGSMAGTPMNYAKAAAIKFCDSILSANGHNYVALVTLNSSSSVVCDFTDELSTISDNINNLYASGGTNINDALVKSDEILCKLSNNNNIVKNVVLLSDGLPESGAYSYEGQYTSSDYYDYEYANTAYATATSLKDKYYLYSLGFFHSLYGSELEFGRRLMSDLQNAGYYDVVNVDDLEFVFGDVADDIVGTKIKGDFKYSSGGTKDYTSTFYYDDAYFSQSSYIYNPSLATMSLCFALSTFGSNDVGNDYTQKSKNARDLLLNKCGFTNFSTNSYMIGGLDNVNKPTTDSIGVAGASKKIEADGEIYTLIAVAVRGSGYESEWTSNFTIGSTGQHQGFREAKENVLSFIDKYINDNNISGKIKIWVTGYSRAAATSNLVGAALDDGTATHFITSLGESTSLASKDVFTYCFETPAGGLTSDNLKSSVYKNIYSIINPNDPVPKVAPAAMSFGRYGIDKILPTNENDANYSSKKESMLKMFNALDSTDEYTVDNFHMKKIAISKLIPGGASPIQDDKHNNISQSVFLDDFINRLIKEFIETRTNYVNYYQTDIRNISSAFFGATSEQTDKLIESLKDKFTNNWGDIVSPLLNLNPFKPAQDKEDEAYAVIARFLREGLNEAEIPYDENEINQATRSLADLLVAYVVNHPNLTTTMVSNIDGIGSAHYPELCLSWLQSMDKNYTTNAKDTFSNGTYRIVHINCPVDFTVTDKDGNVVAKMINDEPQVINDSSIITAINEDGEKLVYLPSDSGYEIDLVATDDGTMTYSVNEFDPTIGDTVRITNYYDVSISNSNTLKADVPEYSEEDINTGTENGTSTIYSLEDNNGNLLEADVDIKGTEATEAYYTVVLIADQEDYGMVTGQGIRQMGNYAQVEATAYDGYKFTGWYNGDNLVSKDETYRFCVTEDITLTAKFEKESANRAGGGSSSSKLSQVKADVPAGTVDKGTKVVLSNSNSSAAIYYTIDGSTPTTSSTKYSGPISVDEDMTIKAIAVKSGYTTSNVATFKYSVNGEPIFTLKDKAEEIRYMNAYDDGSFKPDQAATRYEILTALNNLFDFENITDVTEFSDVASSYKGLVNKFACTDVINGYEDGSFRGSNGITRAELVKILSIMFEIADNGYGDSTYSDISNHWARSYINTYAKSGYVQGYPDGTFKPDNEVTRAEFVKIINNILGINDDALSGIYSDISINDISGHWAERDIRYVVKL